MEEMMIEGSTPGVLIYVRNKHSVAVSKYQPERTVLFVHGATYPASATFDLALDGFSWMDYIAWHGYDVYLLDLRGYGRSTRPKEMAENPYANPPVVTGVTAIEDISAVVGFILERRKISKLQLIGWSWGATLVGSYATQNPDKVDRLVQYGPPWVCANLLSPPARMAAYRTLTREQVAATWYESVRDKAVELIPPSWFDALLTAICASDAIGASQVPPVVRAPNGVLRDVYEFHGAGRPYYDAAKITVPILLVVGEWDRDTPPYMAHSQFFLLVNSPDKRLIQLAGATHHVMLETNRMKLFTAVQSFLDQVNGVNDNAPSAIAVNPC